jgi:malonyl CoA-acyl carrier protein transacylase
MVVFLFPGQSSAAPAIVSRALAVHPAAAKVADRARHVLGVRADRALDPNGAVLESNRDVQIAVFLATQMHLAAATSCTSAPSISQRRSRSSMNAAAATTRRLAA